MGLRIMQYRAKLIRAFLAIEGTGTTVVCVLRNSREKNKAGFEKNARLDRR